MSEKTSITRGLRLLDAAVARERSARPGFTASRLSDVTGIERSHVSRLTQELRELRYLERTDSLTFRAGEEFFTVAAALNTPWVRAARVELRSLAARFAVTARLTARNDARALVLRHESSIGAPGSAVQAGTVTPTWCTGAGRALLWDHTGAALDSLLGDVQFVGVGGPGAARTVAGVVALMERDRQGGLIHAIEEFEEGVVDFAIPLRAPNSEIVAALSATTTTEFGRRATARLCSALLDGAERLVAAMDDGRNPLSSALRTRAGRTNHPQRQDSVD
jgi:DNA-binding IclR family transcriptional regulator